MKGRRGDSTVGSDLVRGRPPFWRFSSLLFLAGILLLILVPATASASFDVGVAGYDVSFPECQGSLPVSPRGHLVVGVNGGRAFTQNPCFASEYRWAASNGQTPAIYMNLNSPSGPGLDQAGNGPRGTCAAGDAGCRAFNYGYNAAGYADRYARSSTGGSNRWWLDVETDNYWSSRSDLNAQVIQGAVTYFQKAGVSVGIYSIAPMWRQIAGGYAPGLPIWVAQTSLSTPTIAYCGSNYAFGGGTALMVQHWDGYKDVDYVCPGRSVDGISAEGLMKRPIVIPSSKPAPSKSTQSGITPLGSRANGRLVGHAGGASVSYGFDYAGNNVSQTVTLDFSPHGPDIANGVFLRVTVGGNEVAHIRGTDTPTPGHLTVTFSSRSAGPVVVALSNYNRSELTPVTYTVQR